MRRRPDRVALAAGTVFVVLGVLFFLERMGWVDVRGAYVWPVILIGVGVALLVGGRPESRTPVVIPPPVVADRAAEKDEGPATTDS